MVTWTPKRVAKFWAKVKRGGPDDCWLWLGAKTGNHRYGYLIVHEKGRRIEVKAHRAAYEITHGPFPPSAPQGNHSCDVGLCCNPAHIVPGTQQENIRDMDRKGRRVTLRGDLHPSAKLTRADMKAIRHALATTDITQSALAAHYGVDRLTILRIGKGQTWFGGMPIDRSTNRARGANHARALHLTTDLLRQVRQLRAAGWSQQRIATHLGLGQSTVSAILSGRHWSLR